VQKKLNGSNHPLPQAPNKHTEALVKMAAQKIFTSHFSEQTTIAVLGKYKGRGVMLDNLHEKINKSLNLIEKQIVASPDNIVLQELYLSTLEIYNRDKCIAAVEQEVIDKKGRRVVKASMHAAITSDDHWMVSVTKSGNVRVHLTQSGKAYHAEQMDKNKSILSYKFY